MAAEIHPGQAPSNSSSNPRRLAKASLINGNGHGCALAKSCSGPRVAAAGAAQDGIAINPANIATTEGATRAVTTPERENGVKPTRGRQQKGPQKARPEGHAEHLADRRKRGSPHTGPLGTHIRPTATALDEVERCRVADGKATYTSEGRAAGPRNVDIWIPAIERVSTGDTATSATHQRIGPDQQARGAVLAQVPRPDQAHQAAQHNHHHRDAALRPEARLAEVRRPEQAHLAAQHDHHHRDAALRPEARLAAVCRQLHRRGPVVSPGVFCGSVGT